MQQLLLLPLFLSLTLFMLLLSAPDLPTYCYYSCCYSCCYCYCGFQTPVFVLSAADRTCTSLAAPRAAVSQQDSTSSMAWCNTAQHSTAQHSTAQHSTAQHSTAQHSTAQHCAAQHSTTQQSTAHHSATLRSTAQHSTALHSTAQCSCSRLLVGTAEGLSVRVLQA